MFFPNKNKVSLDYCEINFDLVHKELSKVGVTLKLLWEEYVVKANLSGQLAYSYDKFCKLYSEYCLKNKATSHIEHKPGIITEVDWSGPTMNIIDSTLGEIHKAYLFVGTLPYSQYSYVEAILSMDTAAWINCHVNMFNFFGGTTIRLIPDNLKTGVISHPQKGEVVLNEAYQILAEYYNMAIIPTGVRKPKHKASVEGTVGKIATAIIAKLRNDKFYDLVSLNIAIKKELNIFNKTKFQKREGSRKEIFESIGKPLLHKLPSTPFELFNWSYAHKVGYNYHVVFRKNYYSILFQFIGKMADLKYNSTTLQVYIDGARVATHPLFPKYSKNKYSTFEEHMPSGAIAMPWDTKRILDWAKKIGPNTLNVIDRILNSVKIKEQGFNSALAVLKLSKDYSHDMFEKACEYALANFQLPRYNHINSILKNKQVIDDKKDKTSQSTGYLRGSKYYGGKNNE